MKDKGKFTPGPWCFWDHYSGEPDAFVVGPENFVTVADVRQGASDVPGDPAANARLISAAPDLLAALKALLDHAGIADAAPEDVDEEDRALERAARAAIAKATQAGSQDLSRVGEGETK